MKTDHLIIIFILACPLAALLLGWLAAELSTGRDIRRLRRLRRCGRPADLHDTERRLERRLSFHFRKSKTTNP